MSGWVFIVRIREATLESAIDQLAGGHRNTSRNSWLCTYLAAARMAAAGYDLDVEGAQQAVRDLFVVLPANARGKLSPFLRGESPYHWGQVAQSGRTTVWNTGTRNGTQRVLFTQDHMGNGLRADALDVLLNAIGGMGALPPRDALALLLTRDHDWPQEPARAQLVQTAAQYLGLSTADFERLTADVELDSPWLGVPEWDPALLQAARGPVEHEDPAQGGPEDAAPHVLPIAPEHLVEGFEDFLADYGLIIGSREEAMDLLAAGLGSQFLLMAGPSGSGKSTLSTALAAFFSTRGRRTKVDGVKHLARIQEFLGYRSRLADDQFIVTDALLQLLRISGDAEQAVPFIQIEEANLSPIEGYFSPLIHELGHPVVPVVQVSLHHGDDPAPTQAADVKVPAKLVLSPFPRFVGTLNVDAGSPAPARKVIGRACVMLFEPPEFEVALGAADSSLRPSVDTADGPAADAIGSPSDALERYVASGGTDLQEAMRIRNVWLKDAIGLEVISPRDVLRSLLYMSWYVELAESAGVEHEVAVACAADNALLHFILPMLPAAQFSKALTGLDSRPLTGLLARRLDRLRATSAAQGFGPPSDFWGALS